MEYKTMKIEDIITWCKEHGEVAWLKDIAAKPVPTKDKDKKPTYDEDGNAITHQITFIELKLAFCEKFMPELLPEKKPKKPSMFDLIKSL